MSRRRTGLVFGVWVLLVLVAVFGVALNVPVVWGSETIHIRADGRIDPPTAPITTTDNITYTFTGNISSDADGIVVERSNITIDGNGYTLKSLGSGIGFYLSGIDDWNRLYNVTIKRTNIQGLDVGIYLVWSNNITICWNNLTNNGVGVYIISSDYNVVSGNNITDSRGGGVDFWYSSGNVIAGNDIANNSDRGVYLYASSFNLFSTNNITSNGKGGIYGGVYLVSWSNNNSLSYNKIANNNRWGVNVMESSFHIFMGNSITNNSEIGVILQFSSNNMFKNNSIRGNRDDFRVWGSDLTHFIQDVDTSNTVDEKPIYYLLNQNALTITRSTYPNIGYLALINSTNVSIEGLELRSKGQGVLLAYTTSSLISNNTIIDNGFGVDIIASHNNTIYKNEIANNREHGLDFVWSNNNTVFMSDIANNGNIGIWLAGSSNNIVSSNDIRNSTKGVNPSLSSNGNTISANNITHNTVGIYLWESSNNTIYHNNLLNNTNQVYSDASVNVWDDGYLSGGNFWSDYTGVDEKSGSYQNETGSDGIADSPYVIDANNQDNYPLMGPFNTFEAGTWNGVTYSVDVVSNSTVLGFAFSVSEKMISFNVTGLDSTEGFCRVTIPNALLGGPYAILVDGAQPITLNQTSNETHTFLYFTYKHSTRPVQIIGTTVVPEFPSTLTLPLLLTLATLTAILTKTRVNRQRRSRQHC